MSFEDEYVDDMEREAAPPAEASNSTEVGEEQEGEEAAQKQNPRSIMVRGQTERPMTEKEIRDAKARLDKQRRQKNIKLMQEIRDEIPKICKDVGLAIGPTEAFMLGAPQIDVWQDDPSIITDLMNAANKRKKRTGSDEERMQQTTNIMTVADRITALYKEKVGLDAVPTVKQIEREVREGIENMAHIAASTATTNARKQGKSEEEAKAIGRQAAMKAKQDGEADAYRQGLLNPTMRILNNMEKIPKKEQEMLENEKLRNDHPETYDIKMLIEDGKYPHISDYILSKEYCILSAEYDVLKYECGLYHRMHGDKSEGYKEDIRYLMLKTLNAVDDLPEKNYLINLLTTKTAKNNVADDMEDKLKERRRDELYDPDPGDISWRNKVVTVTADGLQTADHDRQVYHRVQIPHDCPDMDAKLECPKFDKWLAALCIGANKKRDRRKEYLVWQLIAMCITNNMWRLERYWAILADPGSGKGTLLKVLEMILGVENTHAFEISAFDGANSGTNDYEHMINKLLNYDSDGTHRAKIELTRFYKMVVFEPFTINTKYKPTYNAIITGTKVVAFSEIKFEMDDNQWRRMLPIRIYSEFDKMGTGKPGYHKRFKDELPAILQKALKTAINMTKYNESRTADEMDIIDGYTKFEKQNVVMQPDSTEMVKILRDTMFKRSDKPIVIEALAEIIGSMLSRQGYGPEIIEARKNHSSIGQLFSKYRNAENKRKSEFFIDVNDKGRTYYEPDPDVVPLQLDGDNSTTGNKSGTTNQDDAPGKDNTPKKDNAPEPEPEPTPTTNNDNTYRPSQWPEDRPTPDEFIERCDVYDMPIEVAETFRNKVDDYYRNGNYASIIAETRKFWNIKEPDKNEKVAVLKEILNWFSGR